MITNASPAFTDQCFYDSALRDLLHKGSFIARTWGFKARQNLIGEFSVKVRSRVSFCVRPDGKPFSNSFVDAFFCVVGWRRAFIRNKLFSNLSLGAILMEYSRMQTFMKRKERFRQASNEWNKSNHSFWTMLTKSIHFSTYQIRFIMENMPPSYCFVTYGRFDR